MNPYGHIVARLDGGEVENDFSRYETLAQKGLAGFIVFGGEIEAVREGIRRLQALSGLPLLIASDLEEGAGQQLQGATRFPSQMAQAKAVENGMDIEKLRSLYRAVAAEALYAGINTALAPVLDVNTNPLNPIIATRAFGESPETVSALGVEAIRALQGSGINACAKHFPGHGDTEADSHLALPRIRKDMDALRSLELVPFAAALGAGVSAVMLGHLSCPAIEPSGIPASVSKKALKLLREDMGFSGITMTDALNMGGIKEAFKETSTDEAEARAAAMALQAGVDLLLHPTDPDRLAAALKNIKPDEDRITDFRQYRCAPQKPAPFSFDDHKKLSDEVARTAISIEGNPAPKGKPFFLFLSDENNLDKHARPFLDELERKRVSFKYKFIYAPETPSSLSNEPGRDLIIVVFSTVRAWKGDTATTLRKSIETLSAKAHAVVSFGNPYAVSKMPGIPKLIAYWDAAASQKAAVDVLFRD